ncbi:hypothetical protein WJX81_008163 [Elliptochloris bilobata]|uniref:Uncharacterized protein n=1 Tax=Elliptochloris bilobata TaxID=381761 RepID=A0AAW1QHR8_9CHLO
MGIFACQAVSAGVPRALLQDGRMAGPPCPGTRYGWFHCQEAEHTPGNICVPLCQPGRGAVCVACTDANATCNAAWPSFNGKLAAHFRVNSTQSCRATSETLRVAQQLGAGSPPSNAGAEPPAATPAAAPPVAVPVDVTATRDAAARVSLAGLAAEAAAPAEATSAAL